MYRIGLCQRKRGVWESVYFSLALIPPSSKIGYSFPPRYRHRIFYRYSVVLCAESVEVTRADSRRWCAQQTNGRVVDIDDWRPQQKREGERELFLFFSFQTLHKKRERKENNKKEWSTSSIFRCGDRSRCDEGVGRSVLDYGPVYIEGNRQAVNHGSAARQRCELRRKEEMTKGKRWRRSSRMEKVLCN